MREIELPGSGTRTTSVAFGCGGLLRIPDAGDRGRLLETAFDAGIRHFDNARMYGLGQCEAETRPFLQRRRHEVTVTTKFGLATAGSEAGLRRIQGPVRRLLRAMPFLRAAARKVAGGSTVRRVFSVQEAKASLEKSLMEMGVERVDLLLAHEAQLEDFDGDGLAEATAAWAQEGLVGGTGVSGHLRETVAVATRFPAFSRCLQVPCDVFQPALPDVLAASSGVVGTFSMLRRSLAPVAAHLEGDPALRSQWSDRLGIDLADQDSLAAALISVCRAANPQGFSIVFTSNPRRLTALVRLLVELDCKAPEVARFGREVEGAWKGGDPVRDGF
jgi:D-threo-aldose 1-dehydrogenase